MSYNIFAIQPISRTYQGIRYRSTLEARWAIFFTLSNIPFFYEEQAYGIKPCCGYLPDFWLPDGAMYLEIKGQSPNRKEKGKAESLCIEFKKSICVAVGDPYKTVEAHWFWFCSWEHAPFTPSDVVDGKAISHHLFDSEHDSIPFFVQPDQVIQLDIDGIYLYAGPQHGVGLSWISHLGYINEYNDKGAWSIRPDVGKAVSGWLGGDQCRFARRELENNALTARTWSFW